MVFTRKNGTFQLTTNGNLACPELGQSTSSEFRYNTALELLNQMGGNLTVEYFTMILKAVHQQGTAFSSVYDLANREIHVYYNHNYSCRVIFNLDYELGLGYHSYHLPTYFSFLSPPSPSIPDDNHTVPISPLDVIVLSIPIGGITLAILVLLRRMKSKEPL